jgi:predicted dehydrogenase
MSRFIARDARYSRTGRREYDPRDGLLLSEANFMITLAFAGVAHIHTPDFINKIKKRGDIRVKTIWDPIPERGRKRADDLGATFTSDDQSIYTDNDIQAVVVCSETDRHQPIVEGVTTARKHLFVEKPLGMGSADGYAMADAIEKTGVIFQTGYFQRGFPENLFIKQQIEKGAFGRITRVRGSNCHSGALGGWFDSKPADVANDWRWMADPKQSGVGAFGDLGTHSLDILLWWFGDVTAVTAQIDTGTNRYDSCDETGEGMIRFKNGTIGTLAASWDDLRDPMTYLVTGTEGHAAVINGHLHFQTKHDTGFDGTQPLRKSELPPALPHAFDLFLDAITGKKDVPLVKPREAAYRSAVMEAMYKGAATGTWVKPA